MVNKKTVFEGIETETSFFKLQELTRREVQLTLNFAV